MYTIYMTIILTYKGDFHFLWECARVILLAFWGKVTEPGSLCNLRNRINRNLVDKTGKTLALRMSLSTIRIKPTLQLQYVKSYTWSLQMMTYLMSCHNLGLRQFQNQLFRSP